MKGDDDQAMISDRVACNTPDLHVASIIRDIIVVKNQIEPARSWFANGDPIGK